MLKFGNKEFRNLQEQVEENMKDIESLKSGQAVLDEFGIKVVGEADSVADMPTVAEYKEETPDWEYGDAFAVGTEPPYTMYILTRANGEHEADYWFDIGVFPMPGPQGPQGPQGSQGPQGQTGASGQDGADAGFGTISANASTLLPNQSATASVVASGPNTAKVLEFSFGIPQGIQGEQGVQGETGATGKEALVMNNYLYDNLDPGERESYIYPPSYFNRTPETDEYFPAYMKNTVTGDMFITICQVTNASNNRMVVVKSTKITGTAAGFGTPTISVSQLSAGSTPTASITASGTDDAKVFAFSFGLPTAAPSVLVTGVSGTLTVAQLNTLHTQSDSVVVFRSSSLVEYTLQRWYENNDNIVFVCLYNYTPYRTSVYKCTVDRSTRAYLIEADQAVKVNRYNISSAIDSSTNETAGKVLTADGNGGASWEDAAAGVEVVSLSTSTGTLSTDDYNKAAGESCVIIYQDSSGTNLELRKYDETSTTIQYASIHGDFLSPDTSTRLYKLAITKSSKYYELTGNHLPITNSNIKTGSLVADKYLKSNGSGGASWGDAPSQVQADWNESSQSSPAYIQNKPTIPTVPVTDVTVNGTSVLDGTVAKVLVDTVDGATDGTNWTSLTINGTTAAIPQSSAQVQADWTESDTTDPSYIQNKPTLATVATTGDYDDLLNKPDLSVYAETSDLATVATTGDYDDLLNKPTIPTNYVTTDTNQTIAGNKKFEALTDFYNDVTFYSGAGYLEGTIDVSRGSLDLVGFSGLKTAGSTYKLLIPSTSSYTANKTIATTDDIPTIPVQDVKINNQSIVINNEVNLGSASVCDVTNSITSGSTAVVTGGSIYTALNNKLDATACTYQTTAPTAAATDGGVHIVYLSAEPATKYSGYIYMIAEA